MPELIEDHDQERLAVELPPAIENGELHLYYQPIVSLTDRSATKLEALPRWDHPRHGLLTSARFIDVARDAGLLPGLEAWAVNEAMSQLHNWSGGLPGELSITVNLSTGYASDPTFTASLGADAEGEAAAIHRFGVELAEGALAELSGEAASTLRDLTDRGIDLTLDGFTGAIGLERLRSLPISTLKVKPEVITGIPDRAASRELVATAIACARELGLSVVATGIENPGQAAYLREAGCRFGQGFLFSVPMPAEALEARM